MGKEEITGKIDRLQDIMTEAKEIICDIEPHINKIKCEATSKFENISVKTINFGKLNIRIQNVLARGNVNTMGELFRLGSYGFLRLRNAGKVMADVIKDKFKESYDAEWV